MSKFTNIIKSRFKDKEDFYFERLETCLSCDKWSLNSGESKGSLYELASFGKGHCNLCGCGEHKLRMPLEECPLGKWKAQEGLKNERKIDIELLSKDMVDISYIEDIPVLDYGVIKYKSNSAINVQLLSQKYTETVVKSSCGCTVPKLKENDKGYLLNITYDTKRLGSFSKHITITFINKGVQDVLTIKIKGIVTNTI